MHCGAQLAEQAKPHGEGILGGGGGGMGDAAQQLGLHRCGAHEGEQDGPQGDWAGIIGGGGGIIGGIIGGGAGIALQH